MIRYFYTYEFASGTPQFKGMADTGSTYRQPLPPGFGAVVVPFDVYENGLDTMPVESLRLAIWDQVKARREATIAAGASTPAGMFDTDRESVINVMGAALAATILMVGEATPTIGGDPAVAAALAALDTAFPIDWTLADNNVSSLTPGETVLAGIVTFAHVNAAHQRARELRIALEAGATNTDVLQIDISTGWPGT